MIFLLWEETIIKTKPHNFNFSQNFRGTIDARIHKEDIDTVSGDVIFLPWFQLLKIAIATVKDLITAGPWWQCRVRSTYM